MLSAHMCWTERCIERSGKKLRKKQATRLNRLGTMTINLVIFQNDNGNLRVSSLSGSLSQLFMQVLCLWTNKKGLE